MRDLLNDEDSSVQNPTLLVVDDTEDNLDLLEFALKRKPVNLIRATSGPACLELAAQRKPDLILLDIQMPEMDGFETLRRLRANPNTAKIPVIFLTAQKKDADSIATGLAMGADQYLTKPIDTEELLVRTKMLIRLKTAEAELERTRADFMAMLVHDLRSPLIGIKSVVELLQDADKGVPLNNDHFELLGSAHASSRKLLELISDFLDVSKYEGGNIDFDREPVPVSSFIDPIIHQMEFQFRQKNVALTTTYAEGVPKVFADARKTEQVVMNFLSNALKFTKSGGKIEVKIEPLNEREAQGSETIEKQFAKITITDTGVGIAKEELPILFERYKQTSSGKTVKQKGTGLGLVICKLIVQAQGGHVGVESEPGVKTTFFFTMPAATDA
ncbi:MAG: hybrid sensor histidine kinase/response regulator [Bacteroidota bacterium]